MCDLFAAAHAEGAARPGGAGEDANFTLLNVVAQSGAAPMAGMMPRGGGASMMRRMKRSTRRAEDEAGAGAGEEEEEDAAALEMAACGLADGDGFGAAAGAAPGAAPPAPRSMMLFRAAPAARSSAREAFSAGLEESVERSCRSVVAPRR